MCNDQSEAESIDNEMKSIKCERSMLDASSKKKLNHGHGQLKFANLSSGIKRKDQSKALEILEEKIRCMKIEHSEKESQWREEKGLLLQSFDDEREKVGCNFNF